MLQVVGTSGANFGQRGTGFSYQQKIGGPAGRAVSFEPVLRKRNWQERLLNRMSRLGCSVRRRLVYHGCWRVTTGPCVVLLIGGALGFFAAPRVPVHAFGEMKKMMFLRRRRA